MRSRKAAPVRDWVLEVWEKPNAGGPEQWCTWSTTIHEANAVKIRDRLLGNGSTARVRNSRTGAISGEKEPQPVIIECPHCDLPHVAPYDGTCLL